MQKISQLIFLIAFLVLVTASSMARKVVNRAGADDRLHHLIKKRQNDNCVTVNIDDYACRADHCHNTITYIHNCVEHTTNPDCSNYTAHIDICNTTNCRNTTRLIRVCGNGTADNCADIDIVINSCTNGACRNRTSTIHACYNTINTAGAAICTANVGDYDNAVVRAAIETICVDDLVTFLDRILGH